MGLILWRSALPYALSQSSRPLRVHHPAAPVCRRKQEDRNGRWRVPAHDPGPSGSRRERTSRGFRGSRGDGGSHARADGPVVGGSLARTLMLRPPGLGLQRLENLWNCRVRLVKALVGASSAGGFGLGGVGRRVSGSPRRHRFYPCPAFATLTRRGSSTGWRTRRGSLCWPDV